MASASGVIGKIIPRNTKVGITYSFTLDGPDDKWYGTYKTAPPAEGCFVQFDYKTNGAGFHNVEADTLQVTENTGDTSEAPAGAKPAFKASTTKDANIQWQSAAGGAPYPSEPHDPGLLRPVDGSRRHGGCTRGLQRVTWTSLSNSSISPL